MKGVALLVVFFGYAALAYGIDHLQGNCTPFKTVVWPVGQTSGSVSVKCSGSSASATNSAKPTKGTGNIGPGGLALSKKVTTSPLSGGAYVIGPTGVPQPNYLPG